MAEELGLGVTEVRRLIGVYSFMQEHDDTDPQRWSYYEEYLSIRPIANARKDRPELDTAIVNKIQTGEIRRAVDIREKVGPIAKKGGKVLNRFINTPKSLESCFESAQAAGLTSDICKRLKKIRNQLAVPEIKQKMLRLDSEQQRVCLFELRKIHSSAGKHISALEKAAK